MRRMDCTPHSDVHLQKSQDQHHSWISCDSGYSDILLSSRTESGAKHSPYELLSLDEFDETPKENLSLTVTPKKERNKEVSHLLDNDFTRGQLPLTVGWCETPKLCKRDASLRRRLLMCKSTTDVKTDKTTPFTKKTESSSIGRSQYCFNTLVPSPDNVVDGTLASSTLKLDPDFPLSGRKRRLFFQVRSSTLEDGKHDAALFTGFEREFFQSETDLNESIICSDQLTSETLETPCSGKFLPVLSIENTQTPVNGAAANLCESVLSTPLSTQTPKYIRSVSEDSGFGSLTLDKSQDSSVDHDGSFQELLLSSASRGNCETPRLSETKRRSHFQRQQRLSTLREGGSQSEEDNRNISQACLDRNLKNRKNSHPRHKSFSKEDEVFATPLKSATVKPRNHTTPVSVSSAKQGSVTPLCTPTSRLDKVNSFSTASTNRDVTPLRRNSARHEKLSLTPALQLVHAMCQQRAQMMLGQSPSLEEQLRSAASLAETPAMFRTTMPLAGLIGRKMGLGNVDVLTELKKRNLRHILAEILSHVSPRDVFRFGQVSKSWNEIILQNKQASCKRSLYLDELEASIELGSAVHDPDADTRLTLVNRSALRSVQAQSRTSSYGTPQSGTSTLTPLLHSTKQSFSSKQDKFLQVAKTLFNDECLKPCPRCQHPAKCHSVKQEGVCSRDDCGFQFCTTCLCDFHGSKECASHSARRRNKRDILLPGSAQSKRNLRRL